MLDQQRQEHLQQAFGKNPHILAAYLFGSFISGKVNKESDFDLAVVVNNKKYVSVNDAYSLIHKISFPRDLDLSVVDKSSSPLFLFQIVKNGKCIYKRSEKERVRFEAFVLHNYYDTAHIRNIYYLYLKDKFTHANR